MCACRITLTKHIQACKQSVNELLISNPSTSCQNIHFTFYWFNCINFDFQRRKFFADSVSFYKSPDQKSEYQPAKVTNNNNEIKYKKKTYTTNAKHSIFLPIDASTFCLTFQSTIDIELFSCITEICQYLKLKTNFISILNKVVPSVYISLKENSELFSQEIFSNVTFYFFVIESERKKVQMKC